MNVTLVPPDEILNIWRKVKDMLAPAIAYSRGRCTEETVLREILAGGMHLWVIYDEHKIYCAYVTQKVIYPAMTVLEIVFLGGRHRELWVENVHTRLLDFAKTMGAKKLEFTGRRGWTGKAAELGYTERETLFEFDIED